MAKPDRPGARPVAIPGPLATLSIEVLELVRDSFRALAQGNADAARYVISGDRLFDRNCRALLKEFKRLVRTEPQRSPTWLRLLSVTRNLGRVADDLRDVAEGVVSMKEGQIIRHDEGQAPNP